MTESMIIIGFVAYIFAREAFFLYSTNKLVNKLMSHSFNDYQRSLNVGNTVPSPIKVVDTEQEEDLGTLHGIGL